MNARRVVYLRRFLLSLIDLGVKGGSPRSRGINEEINYLANECLPAFNDVLIYEAMVGPFHCYARRLGHLWITYRATDDDLYIVDIQREE